MNAENCAMQAFSIISHLPNATCVACGWSSVIAFQEITNMHILIINFPIERQEYDVNLC